MISREDRDKGMTNANALLGFCDGCNAENALYNPKRDYHECPTCATLYEMSYTARDHLVSLLTITPVLQAWRDHYRIRGLGKAEAIEITEAIVNQLIEDLWDDTPDHAQQI